MRVNLAPDFNHSETVIGMNQTFKSNKITKPQIISVLNIRRSMKGFISKLKRINKKNFLLLQYTSK